MSAEDTPSSPFQTVLITSVEDRPAKAAVCGCPTPARRPNTAPPSVCEVADDLETLADGNHRLAHEAQRMLLTPAPVTQTTLERLRRLLTDLTPAAAAQSRLTCLARTDPELLRDGALVLHERVTSAPQRAADRAVRRWNGRRL